MTGLILNLVLNNDIISYKIVKRELSILIGSLTFWNFLALRFLSTMTWYVRRIFSNFLRYGVYLNQLSYIQIYGVKIGLRRRLADWLFSLPYLFPYGLGWRGHRLEFKTSIGCNFWHPEGGGHFWHQKAISGIRGGHRKGFLAPSIQID